MPNPENVYRSDPDMPLFSKAQGPTMRDKIALQEAHARKSDPKTSHDAAKSVVNIGPVRENILKILHTYGPLTDELISGHYWYGYMPRVSPSGLRSRRAELVKMGFVEKHGQGKTQSGRTCSVWRAK